jgi:hypothetical protein
MINHPAFNSIYKVQISIEPANFVGLGIFSNQEDGETRYEIVDKRLASPFKEVRSFLGTLILARML